MLKTFYPMLQPVYPLLVQQFVDDYQLTTGIALDVGTGPGYLGLELAKITNMEVWFLDYSSEAIEKCKKNVLECELDNKLQYFEADVADMPLESGSADFIMSRGSLWFWKEPVIGLKEISRILKPGGTAFIGGGVGRYVPDTMRERLQKANKEARKKRGDGPRPSLEDVRKWAEEAFDQEQQIKYRVLSDDLEGKDGKWIEIKKDRS
ncbi:class I SAM-dependent methyltransferase [Tindallia californiensis]|uniref:Methyltransferase domain-containing protein n=1 Tax=Tindallia californiensis TaxID=159292 RepID=A0A1H3MDC3_9FIRM|nr:class I SAM-dependent methyltransferase [Tindallia californiensis]SDY74298.1 Methyltransferase domain-containing protein [Tindallia californiensis]